MIFFKKAYIWVYVRRYVFLLLILSIAYCMSTFRYSVKTYQIPVWDEQHYVKMAAEFYRLLLHPTWDTPAKLLEVMPIRQPLYPLLIVPLLFVFGLSNIYTLAIVVNALLAVFSSWAIYLIGKHFMNALSGLIAASLFLSYGWVLMHVHTAYTEISVTAFIIWAIYFLIRSEHLTRKKYSVLFGIFVGLSLITRWISIVFLIGPVGYELWQILKVSHKNLKSKANILVPFLLAIGIAVIPYVHNFYWIFQVYFTNHAVGGEMWKIIPDEVRNPFSLYSFTFYILSIEKLSIPLFYMFIFGVVLSVFSKKNGTYLLLPICISWIFFSFFSIVKSDRFIIPIYPYIALISVYPLYRCVHVRLKSIYILTLIIYSVGMVMGSAWGKGPMGSDLKTMRIGGFELHTTSVMRRPYIYKRSGKEIINYIASDASVSGIERPQVVSLFSYYPLDEQLMVYNDFFQIQPMMMTNFVGTVLVDVEKQVDFLVDTYIVNANYLLIKDAHAIEPYFEKSNYETLSAFVDAASEMYNLDTMFYEVSRFWVTQDSTTIVVKKRRNEIKQRDLEDFKYLLRQKMIQQKLSKN